MPPPFPRRAAGFTIVEVLAALLILTLVILTSLTVFGDRARRLRDAAEMTLAWQALANETEARRRQPFESLVPGQTVPFMTDPAAGGALEGASGDVTIAAETPEIRTLVIRIEWRTGTKAAETTVYRAATGGGSLW